MRRIVLLALLWSTSYAAAETCLIVRHSTTSEQFWVSGANWKYVAGDFPSTMKWKSNITDRNIRKIKSLGGKVVVVTEKYSAVDLESAKKECATPDKVADAK